MSASLANAPVALKATGNARNRIRVIVFKRIGFLYSFLRFLPPARARLGKIPPAGRSRALLLSLGSRIFQETFQTLSFSCAASAKWAKRKHRQEDFPASSMSQAFSWRTFC